ncbi:VPLPA-CTERM sorting domain-containing protein [Rhodovulum steppense]|uniref:Putative secreted protein n=1 Tax=Rhodovulum steppense TaxID=540251 RepID=A0A4R1Z2U8_9RHOB|nr:VPLPA-CTERM sorting domain-containing protein [Rhodovulum steppense]TCM88002.1 putative secreted protein [Rhodovulum steppense]
MNIKNLASASALAVAAAMGAAPGVSASTIVDLGFIIDESGSVGQANYQSSILALRAALEQIPLADANVTYRVGVVSFGNGADVVAAPVVFDSAANKNAVLAALLDEAVPNSIDGGTRQYGLPGGITNATNYVAAFDAIHNAFISSFGSLGDNSILNMATDGGWNSGGNPTARANALYNDNGWDSLSFEAIGGFSQSNLNFLAGIGFDSGGIGGCGITTDAASLQNVTENCFVIDVPSFAAFETAILTKVRKTVIDTGGDPNVVPLPAGLPLMLGVIGAFAFMRRRQMTAA